MKAPVCSVRWCAALPAPESKYCAVHAKRGAKFRTGVASADPCVECDGDGECVECDGEGSHTCGHSKCYDEHDCPTCHGSGKCQSCVDYKPTSDDTFEVRYLAWAFDPGWVPPPPLVCRPWDEAA